MKPPRAGWLRKITCRSAGLALVWGCLVVSLAVAVNAVGIHVVGSVAGWQRWLRVHEGGFVAWRLTLYAATALGWWRMRPRLTQHTQTSEARGRLLRAEVSTVLVILLVEALRSLPFPFHA